ncbi:unnamed protein product, partial [marine sediment metagenome]
HFIFIFKISKYDDKYIKKEMTNRLNSVRQ